MTIEFRNADPSEYREAVDVVATAFLDRPDLDAVTESVKRTWVPERTWIALDDGRIAGVYRSWLTEITVPGGGLVPAAAVGPVTVLPTHRRRGILRGLAAAEDRAIRERGEPLAVLHASEYAIYGRYGYGPATRSTDWTIRTAPAGGVHGTASGSIDLMAPNDPALKAALKAVFDAWRRRQPGEVARRELNWDLNLGLEKAPWGARWKGWVALHRDAAGEADGYVRYTAESTEHDLLPGGVLKVDELVGLTDGAYADLLRFATEIDLIRTVKLENRPETERARWLVRNARAVSDAASWDSVWVRVFDVPAALEARRYEREGRLVLEVIDDGAGGGRHCLQLETEDGRARCTTTNRSPDLTLPVSALGAAYLGGTRLRDIVIATGAEEHREGALVEADALFRTADEPFCSTHF